jgi:RNA polymerase sigma factor (sigma-70 family)
MTLNEAYELYSKDSSDVNKEILGESLLIYVKKYFSSNVGDAAGITSKSSADTLQDTMGDILLEVWERLPKFDKGKSSFVTWVTIIIKNALTDSYKVYGNRQEILLTDADILVHPHRSIDDKLTLKQLVSKLTAKEQALVKYRMQGYSFEDMAYSSGISPEALRKRWQRIQEKLSRFA